MPIRRLCLANTNDITITIVARSVKPSWTGNSGIPEPPELVVDVLVDDDTAELEVELDVEAELD